MHPERFTELRVRPNAQNTRSVSCLGEPKFHLNRLHTIDAKFKTSVVSKKAGCGIALWSNLRLRSFINEDPTRIQFCNNKTKAIFELRKRPYRETSFDHNSLDFLRASRCLLLNLLFFPRLWFSDEDGDACCSELVVGSTRITRSYDSPCLS